MKRTICYLTLVVIGLAVILNGRAGFHSFSSEQVTGLLNQEADHLSLASRREIANRILVLSEEYHIDPLLILSVIAVESRFRPTVQSNRGAIGLMQIKPIVLREIGRPEMLLSDPDHNLQAGVHYLHMLLQKFRGDWIKTLKAYNEGPTRVVRQYGKRTVPVSRYTQKVMAHYQQFRAATF